MKIKLDWDSIGYSEAIRRIRIIKQNPIIEYLDLFASSSGDGYHVYLYTKSEVNSLEYRDMYKDDGKRVVTDLLKRDESPKDVLFQYKILNGKKYQVEFIKRF